VKVHPQTLSNFSQHLYLFWDMTKLSINGKNSCQNEHDFVASLWLWALPCTSYHTTWRSCRPSSARRRGLHHIVVTIPLCAPCFCRTHLSRYVQICSRSSWVSLPYKNDLQQHHLSRIAEAGTATTTNDADAYDAADDEEQWRANTLWKRRQRRQLDPVARSAEEDDHADGI